MKLKKERITFHLSIFFCLGILLSFPSYSSVENPKTIKIALSDSSPPTSYLENGVPAGMFQDILKLLFTYLPEYRPVFAAYPWTRAQHEVQAGRMDIFVTFPSEVRKTYADFTSQSLYTWNYGNLVYNINNPRKNKIESAKSFDDLKTLTFVSQEGIDWENENVPKYIKREYVNKIITMLHLVFKRNKGDFFIMSPEQATYYGKQLGYLSKMGMKKVNFIPNSQVKFHLGVSKANSNKAEILSAIEMVMRKPDFIQKRQEIEMKYEKGFH